MANTEEQTGKAKENILIFCLYYKITDSESAQNEVLNDFFCK